MKTSLFGRAGARADFQHGAAGAPGAAKAAVPRAPRVDPLLAGAAGLCRPLGQVPDVRGGSEPGQGRPDGAGAAAEE